MSIAALASLGIDDPVALVRSYAARLEERTGFRMAAVPVPPEPEFTRWEKTPRGRKWARRYAKDYRRRNLDKVKAAERAKARRWRARHLDLARKRARDGMRKLRARRARARE